METDPTFELVLNAVSQLREKKRLDDKHNQSANIKYIKNATDDGYHWDRLYDFARTASVGFRMAMLKAMGAKEEWWPKTKSNPKPESEVKPGLQLKMHVTNWGQANEYWANYDRIYHHSYIQQKYNNTKNESLVPLDSMMVIFRGKFKEMIQIITNVHLWKDIKQQGVYKAAVRVACIRYTIKKSDTEDIDTPAFKKLKAINGGEMTHAEVAKRELEATIKDEKDKFESERKEWKEPS